MKYYLDCEFDGYGGHLISLALIGENDSSIYLVAIDSGVPADPWVYENVMPVIYTKDTNVDPIHSGRFADSISKYLSGDPDPIIISDWPDDIAYFCKLALTGPGTMIDVPSLKFEVHRVDAYPTELAGAVQHNAWWDAKALKFKLTKDQSHG